MAPGRLCSASHRTWPSGELESRKVAPIPAEGPLDATRVVFNAGRGFTEPVGSRPDGRTPEGLVDDMLGNVVEWCRDWSGTFPEEAVQDPLGPPTQRMQKRIRSGDAWRKFFL